MEKKKTRMTRIQIFLTEMSSNTEKPSLLKKKGLGELQVPKIKLMLHFL